MQFLIPSAIGAGIGNRLALSSEERKTVNIKRDLPAIAAGVTIPTVAIMFIRKHKKLIIIQEAPNGAS